MSALPSITQLSSLSPSLVQDLSRSALGPGDQRALLEVLAASRRHGQALSARVRVDDEAPVLISVLPRHQLMHSTQPFEALLRSDLKSWQVLEVTPPMVHPPPLAHFPYRTPPRPPFEPLAPLLWAVALAGSRSALLPELDGQAAFRVAPGADLDTLYTPPVMADCITRLRRETSGLADVMRWHGIGPERAARLLNALYLQSALIVSRSHPAATNEGWQGYS